MKNVMDKANSETNLLDTCDSDLCNTDELNNLFQTKCELIVEEPVALDSKYLLHMAATGENSVKIGIGLSDYTSEIYCLDDNRLAKLEILDGHSNVVVGIKFSIENNNLIYTASADGKIKLWDLRTSKQIAAEFLETTAESPNRVKPITCFDVCSNNRLLAAGTEVFAGDAYILFWDVRNTKLLGGYWETHTDDITQLKFNLNDANKLISSSTDGLINVYDVKHTSEDDALQDSLNTESSVEQLLWYEHKRADAVCCNTHTADVQLWKMEGAEPYVHFRRADIAKQIRRKSELHCYVAGVHATDSSEVFLLVGSNWNNGECLRGVTAGQTLVSTFIAFENKQRVRCSWYKNRLKLLLTGGERGILNAWKLSNKC